MPTAPPTRPRSRPAPSQARLFRAIADPTRRAMLDRLRLGTLSVNALAADFRQSRPGISRHLRVLRQAALVTEHRQGRQRLCVLTPEPLTQLAAWLHPYQEFWHDSLTALKTHLESQP